MIIGTARSGTNLVVRMLEMHSRIRVPQPLHLPEVFPQLETSYGNLNDDEAMLSLIRDVLLLAARHTVPWPGIPIPESLLDVLPQRSTLGVMAALWQMDTVAAGKKRWCDRSIGIIDHIEQMRSLFPGVQLIWLVRDPRDVAVSARRSVFLPCHPELIARLWRHHQQQAARLAATLPAGSVHLLRYEDLLSDPHTAVSRLCNFLDEDFEPDMLNYFQYANAQRLSTLSESWSNLRRPVLANNTGKYATQLTARQIATIELICGTSMESLKYLSSQPAHPSPARLDSRHHLLLVWMVNILLRLKVETRSIRKDKTHWGRWRRALTVRWITWRQRLRAGSPATPQPASQQPHHLGRNQ